MKLSRNRSLRKRKFIRHFILDPRKLISEKIKIKQSIFTALMHSNVIVDNFSKRRINRISNFVISQEMIERRFGVLLFFILIFNFVFGNILIPIWFYDFKEITSKSIWNFYLFFLLAQSGIFLLDYLLSEILVKFTFSDIDFQKISLSYSPFISLVILVFNNIYLTNKPIFPLWIEASALSILFLWGISKLMDLLLYGFLFNIDWITKRRHPYEKVVYFSAKALNSSARLVENRNSMISERRETYESITDLISCFHIRLFSKSIKISKQEKRGIRISIKKIISELLRLRSNLIISNNETIFENKLAMKRIFISIWKSHFDELIIDAPQIPKKVKAWYLANKLIPSAILLIIWGIIYYFWSTKIESEYAKTITILILTLPLSPYLTQLRLHSENSYDTFSSFDKFRGLNRNRDY